MLIILLSFAVIIAIITSIIDNYSQRAKEDIVMTVAKSSSTYMRSEMERYSLDDIERYIGENSETVSEMITAICTNAEDVTVIITDTSGKILLAVGQSSDEVTMGAVMPQNLMEELENDDAELKIHDMNGVMETPHFVNARVICTDDGYAYGNIFVCATTVILTQLLEIIIKTIVLAILWVMLAALIAVYFISEKVISPLKEISMAAKSFASGKFDTRVEVRGSDEVAALAAAFNNMAESLDNYEKMRNTFISNVSHDLRTPMTSISGFVDGILDGVIPPDKYNYYLRIVSNEIKRLSRLVASLLDISRIQAGERKFTMSAFDVCEMARQILFSFEKKIDDKKLDVEFDLDDENIIVIADRDAIYQCLYNICDNAVKFSREGGLLKISVKRLKNKKYLVSVYNEGQGIADEDLPYVFERFYKSDKSRGLDKTGIGLGLYITKTIIEAHNEEIWVESEYGKNCVFKFTLKAQ